jgi:sugar lactone lactonase YvrE
MSMQVDVQAVVRYPDLLGEGPAYDAAHARLLWVDILGERLHELSLRTDGTWKTGRTRDMGGPVSAVVPTSTGGLLALVGKRVVAVGDDGVLEVFATLDEDGVAVRLNDAKCDPQGRLVAGWVALDGSRPGGVVRVDAKGTVEPIVSDVMVANGLDWSPDGQTFYLVDTRTLSVEAFDYTGGPAGAGMLRGRRTLLSIERGVGAPDGMAVDHQGCLWVAVPYAGEVRRYSPDGVLVDSVETPTLMPTSCVFGGPDGRELFITSQTRGLASPSEENALGITLDRVQAGYQDAAAGALFVCRPGASGPAATPFAG